MQLIHHVLEFCLAPFRCMSSFRWIQVCNSSVMHWDSVTVRIDFGQFLAWRCFVWAFSGMLRLFGVCSVALVSLSEYDLVSPPKKRRKMRKQWDGPGECLSGLTALFCWVSKTLLRLSYWHKNVQAKVNVTWCLILELAYAMEISWEDARGAKGELARAARINPICTSCEPIVNIEYEVSILLFASVIACVSSLNS